MNISGKYYKEKLYPFQDGILNIVKKLKIPFYLTGGTALSRHYFARRYSDDIDLFVNNDKKYPQYLNQIIEKFEELQKNNFLQIEYNQLRKGKDFMQIFISRDFEEEKVLLKMDLINDVAKHYGGFENNPKLGKIDSWRNILSNKLSALFRFEPKDIVDLWIISKIRSFNWDTIVLEAKTKEIGVDPIAFHKILNSFPLTELKSIKWIKEIDKDVFKKDLLIIANDILKGSANSLFI